MLSEENVMLVTKLTREVLKYRRFKARWIEEGYEEIGENGGRLWEIYRGRRMGQKIRDARIAPDGMTVFVKAIIPHLTCLGGGSR